MISLVVGGGKYGGEAVEYLLNLKKNFIVVDESEECYVAKNYDLERISIDKLQIGKAKNYFLKGSVKEVLKIVESFKPEYVFTTAPLHIAAAIVKEKYGLKEWNEGVNYVLAGIPFKIVVSAGRGTVVVSYNRDGVCKPKCNAPDTCPVTKIRKPCAMYELLRFAAPNGMILESHQLKPGLGALKGEEILELIKNCMGKDKVIVGTACKCHGVITALRHTKN